MSAEVWVPVPPERAFAVSRTQGAVRLRWDPFICSQWLLDGAIAPGRGVRTHTRSRLGPRMVSEYVAYHPPVSVGMKMVEGPWFFARFGGGWRFVAEGDGTRTIWRYTLLANHVEKCRLCRPFATKFGGGARNAGQPEPSWRR
ncbi:MAG: SRPBCC family protein [Acidimicrobiales bacterium]